MITDASGTYVLVLSCSCTRTIRIGRLGNMRLRPGCYLYVGSAFGPGGLSARIGHHRRRALRSHWHVDYLRWYTRLESVWYACGIRCEHEWATKIAAMPGAAMGLWGLGSSDCRCETHLYCFEKTPPATGLRQALGADATVMTDTGSAPQKTRR